MCSIGNTRNNDWTATRTTRLLKIHEGHWSVGNFLDSNEKMYKISTTSEALPAI